MPFVWSLDRRFCATAFKALAMWMLKSLAMMSCVNIITITDSISVTFSNLQCHEAVDYQDAHDSLVSRFADYAKDFVSHEDFVSLGRWARGGCSPSIFES